MPEPILVAISAALAGKAVTSLYDFVRNRFSARKEAVLALEAANGAAPDSPEVQVLAAELEKAEAADPEFRAELRQQWMSFQRAEHQVVNMDVSGTVSGGKIVQAQRIDGDITFN